MTGEASRERFLHQPTGLEPHSGPWPDAQSLEGFGVESLSGFAPFDGEHAEVAELQSVALAQLHDHVIEESLHGYLDHGFRLARGGRNVLHHFSLADCLHLARAGRQSLCLAADVLTVVVIAIKSGRTQLRRRRASRGSVAPYWVSRIKRGVLASASLLVPVILALIAEEGGSAVSV